METLQLAQMLADLSSLNAAVRSPAPSGWPLFFAMLVVVCPLSVPSANAPFPQEPNAAAALVTANKAINAETLSVSHRPTEDLRRAHSSQGLQRNVGTAASGSPPSPSPASSNAARFDKFGRRILMSPPLTRTNSAQASGAATPRRDSELEDDLDRASTLMALYEIRAKLKQQDNSSLIKAREKITELAARQQQHQAPNTAVPAGAGKRESSRFSYPK
ncbi:hypothetical protein F5X68DRAFT_202501 [Plectosphaerella plurivora]|uniref:Uncharacterized protein n=1 Tax=Plectosphaerella plurivora TaxID=936078 RepID=A0A9P8VFV2_9PEZI|nr:hypothetical protein F5X68DRAFT_202501 [Plectosphaerella plurivora]